MTGGAVSNTFHLCLDVPDLDAAVGFYSELFGQQPTKHKPGYAKFELADPPVAIALQQADRPALSHLGIRVETTAEVEGAGSAAQRQWPRDPRRARHRLLLCPPGQGLGRRPLGKSLGDLHRARRHRG